MRFRTYSLFVLGVLLPFELCALPRPQNTSNGSVVEAARRAREQKGRDRANPPRMYDNDAISDLKGSISVIGNSPAAPPTPAAVPADAAKPGELAPVPAVKDEAYWRKQFADARQKLALDAKELDILQREFGLKQQQYYSDPNQALQEQTSRNDLDKTRQQIEIKKVAVEKDQQAIAALEEDLRKSGGNVGWSQEGATATAPVPPVAPVPGPPGAVQ